jgi:hypothetical protein
MGAGQQLTDLSVLMLLRLHIAHICYAGSRFETAPDFTGFIEWSSIGLSTVTGSPKLQLRVAASFRGRCGDYFSRCQSLACVSMPSIGSFLISRLRWADFFGGFVLQSGDANHRFLRGNVSVSGTAASLHAERIARNPGSIARLRTEREGWRKTPDFDVRGCAEKFTHFTRPTNRSPEDLETEFGENETVESALLR